MYTIILLESPQVETLPGGQVKVAFSGGFSLSRTVAGDLGEAQLDVPMDYVDIASGTTLLTDSDGLVSISVAHEEVEGVYKTATHEEVEGVYKTAIQVPITEGADLEPLLEWSEGPDRHGPHIRCILTKDAETGEPCLIVRCKHRTRQELSSLVAVAQAWLKTVT